MNLGPCGFSYGARCTSKKLGTKSRVLEVRRQKLCKVTTEVHPTDTEPMILGVGVWLSRVDRVMDGSKPKG